MAQKRAPRFIDCIIVFDTIKVNLLYLYVFIREQRVELTLRHVVQKSQVFSLQLVMEGKKANVVNKFEWTVHARKQRSR